MASRSVETERRGRGEARERVLDAALELFSGHGVSGTSFQMIADALGVTKAAVYHQFQSKNDLVIAVTERELGILEERLRAVEAAAGDDTALARAALLDQVIDLAVADRGLVGTLQFDPVIVGVLADHQPFADYVTRLFGALLGEGTDENLVAGAMLSGAIAVGVMHPSVAHLDSADLRDHIQKILRRIIFEGVDTAPTN
ncbi:TetR/AcrR family transcriptional regulator [Gordonia rhizosphera]|uniref:TetR/AcrR family transcriptional regulator n=1 Tax=Gordonia rhizosphera TaxID=83341 RepID=UPI001FDF6396|nr:TetR/AcrR family transcriptional regulator [Gordonia rhizosphera]